MFHLVIVHFFGMLKKKGIYTKYLCLLSKKTPGLLNLGAQIRCAQNQYTAVKAGLKYPLITLGSKLINIARRSLSRRRGLSFKEQKRKKKLCNTNYVSIIH